MNDYTIELTLSHYNKSIKSFIDENSFVKINNLFNKLPFGFSNYEIPEIGYLGIKILNYLTNDEWFIYRESVTRNMDGIIEVRIDKNKSIEEFLIKNLNNDNIPDTFYILENKKLSVN
ncbi:MAG TPA: hypothetical protein PLG90_01770 [Ignavibacteria bacterium]|nr:hypothetical protein [Ignavibacteria bacterium]